MDIYESNLNVKKYNKKFEYIHIHITYDPKMRGWQVYEGSQKCWMLSDLHSCYETQIILVKERNNKEYQDNLSESIRMKKEEQEKQKLEKQQACELQRLEWDKRKTVAELETERHIIALDILATANALGSNVRTNFKNVNSLILLLHNNKDFFNKHYAKNINNIITQLYNQLKKKPTLENRETELVQKEKNILIKKREVEIKKQQFSEKSPYILKYGLEDNGREIIYIGCSDNIQHRFESHKRYTVEAHATKSNRTPHEIMKKLAIDTGCKMEIEHLQNFKNEEEAIDSYYKNPKFIITNLVRGGYHEKGSLPYLGTRKKWAKIRKNPSYIRIIQFLKTH